MKLSQKEKGMIIVALDMRKNYIETGNAGCSAADITKFKRKGIEVNTLSTREMQLVIDTEQLIKKMWAS